MSGVAYMTQEDMDIVKKYNFYIKKKQELDDAFAEFNDALTKVANDIQVIQEHHKYQMTKDQGEHLTLYLDKRQKVYDKVTNNFLAYMYMKKNISDEIENVEAMINDAKSKVYEVASKYGVNPEYLICR